MKNKPSVNQTETNSQGSSIKKTTDKQGNFQNPDLSTDFDPKSTELQTSWASLAESIYCLNVYPNGITLSIHNNQSNPDEEGSQKFSPQQFHLRLKETSTYQLAEGKYLLYKENYKTALEMILLRLQKSGKLQTSVWYFGTVSDPFLNFHKKFDVIMGCLELLQKYIPQKIVFQTRSPMVISILGMLKYLGERAVTAIAIETISEKALARYTPGLPRIGERLLAADGLRKQGITVNLQVSPLLPYGDPKRDAWDFAEILEQHADYITFGCLATGDEQEEKQLKLIPLAQRLAIDQQYYWLRPFSYQYLFQGIKALAPEKLLLPIKAYVAPKQLKLFAA